MTSGVTELWLAVLDDALRLASGAPACGDHRPVTPIQRQKALWWIRSRRGYPGSFEWVCAHLGLNPGAVRVRLSSSVPASAHRVDLTGPL